MDPCNEDDTGHDDAYDGVREYAMTTVEGTVITDVDVKAYYGGGTWFVSNWYFAGCKVSPTERGKFAT